MVKDFHQLLFSWHTKSCGRRGGEKRSVWKKKYAAVRSVTHFVEIQSMIFFFVSDRFELHFCCPGMQRILLADDVSFYPINEKTLLESLKQLFMPLQTIKCANGKLLQLQTPANMISYSISISFTWNKCPRTHQSSENVVVVLRHHTHGQGLRGEKSCD